MERFDDICPENEFEDKNYNEEYDREYSFDQGYEWTEEDAWDALTDGMVICQAIRWNTMQ